MSLPISRQKRLMGKSAQHWSPEPHTLLKYLLPLHPDFLHICFPQAQQSFNWIFSDLEVIRKNPWGGRADLNWKSSLSAGEKENTQRCQGTVQEWSCMRRILNACEKTSLVTSVSWKHGIVLGVCFCVPPRCGREERLPQLTHYRLLLSSLN